MQALHPTQGKSLVNPYLRWGKCLNMIFLYIKLDIVISSAMLKATEFVFSNCSQWVLLVFIAWFCDIRKKSAKIKSAYKQDYVHCTGDVDFDFAGPAIQASAVAGYVRFLLEEKRENFNIAAVRIWEVLVTTKMKWGALKEKETGTQMTFPP